MESQSKGEASIWSIWPKRSIRALILRFLGPLWEKGFFKLAPFRILVMVLGETDRPASVKSSSDMWLALAPFHRPTARSATKALMLVGMKLEGLRPVLPWTSDDAPASS